MLALMETQTQVHVSFAEVKERLLAIKTPSADTVEQILDRIQALLTLLTTFEEVYPEQYRTQMIGVTLTPKELPDEEENFIDHFLHLVEKQFPLDFEGRFGADAGGDGPGRRAGAGFEELRAAHHHQSPA